MPTPNLAWPTLILKPSRFHRARLISKFYPTLSEFFIDLDCVVDHNSQTCYLILWLQKFFILLLIFKIDFYKNLILAIITNLKCKYTIIDCLRFHAACLCFFFFISYDTFNSILCSEMRLSHKMKSDNRDRWSKPMKRTEKEIAVVLPFAAIMGLCARVGTAFRDLFPFRLSDGEVPRRVELMRKQCSFSSSPPPFSLMLI